MSAWGASAGTAGIDRDARASLVGLSEATTRVATQLGPDAREAVVFQPELHGVCTLPEMGQVTLLDLPVRARRRARYHVTTAADGEFSLGPANAGGLDIEAHCPSGDQGTKHVDVSPTLGTVVIDVKPGGSITGRVVDGKGLAVAGASVMATSIQATERTTIINGRVVGGVQAMTNTKGEFELRGLGPGPYRLRALDRGRPRHAERAAVVQRRGRGDSPPAASVCSRLPAPGARAAAAAAAGA